jgi:hypothetical protein
MAASAGPGHGDWVDIPQAGSARSSGCAAVMISATAPATQ